MNFNTSQKKPVKGKGKTSIIDKKHQANLKKNNGLYFQIGLIVSLFLVFGAFQLKFEKVNQFTEDIILNEDEVLYVSAPVFEIEKKVESKQKIQKEVKQQKLIDKFIETSDDDKIIETMDDCNFFIESDDKNLDALFRDAGIDLNVLFRNRSLLDDVE